MLRMTIKLEIPKGGALVNACPHDDSDPSFVYACIDDCPICDKCTTFSWQNCETCNSTLGGERHAVAVIFVGTERKSEYYSACVDCMREVEG